MRVGSDPCALVVGSGAGGDASRDVTGDIPRTKMFHVCVVPGHHREEDYLKASVFVAKGNPIREAKDIPRAQAARDSEWKRPWGRKCWITGSVMEYDEVRRMALPSKKAVQFGRVFALCREAQQASAGGKKTQRKSCLRGFLCLGSELEMSLCSRSSHRLHLSCGRRMRNRHTRRAS